MPLHPCEQVGLNLSNRQPTTCVDALIEAAAAAGSGQQQQGQDPQHPHGHGLQQAEPVSRERLLASILTRLEPMLERLAAEGFGPFEADYCRHWLHSDQQVCAGGGMLADQAKGMPGCLLMCLCDGSHGPPEPSRLPPPPLKAWAALPLPSARSAHTMLLRASMGTPPGLALLSVRCRCSWRRAGATSL